MASGQSTNGSKPRRRKEEPPDVKFSKFLSYICRHGAERRGLQVHDGGYVDVSAILGLEQDRRHTEEDVRRAVANCPKQRFALREEPSSGLQIRANQGHTIEVEDLELTPVLRADEAPVVVHGTNRRAWSGIKGRGLSRMKRNHIHFAPGLPGESGVISGMRSSCQVLVYINLKKALEDGFKFYRSANDVILCPGNEEGILPVKYFAEVRELPSGNPLPF